VGRTRSAGGFAAGASFMAAGLSAAPHPPARKTAAVVSERAMKPRRSRERLGVFMGGRKRFTGRSEVTRTETERPKNHTLFVPIFR
jgi:hypothetical protein